MGDGQRLHGSPKGFRHAQRPFPQGARKDDDEFLAAVTGRQVARAAQTLLEDAGRGPEAVVPRLMPVGVLEILRS